MFLTERQLGFVRWSEDVKIPGQHEKSRGKNNNSGITTAYSNNLHVWTTFKIRARRAESGLSKTGSANHFSANTPTLSGHTAQRSIT